MVCFSNVVYKGKPEFSYVHICTHPHTPQLRPKFPVK